MKHHATPRFWQHYRSLPEDIQRIADKSFELLRNAPKHPSLHFKKVGRFWSARVGLYYRALAVPVDADLVWFWIGSHAQYDKLINRS